MPSNYQYVKTKLSKVKWGKFYLRLGIREADDLYSEKVLKETEIRGESEFTVSVFQEANMEFIGKGDIVVVESWG